MTGLCCIIDDIMSLIKANASLQPFIFCMISLFFASVIVANFHYAKQLCDMYFNGCEKLCIFLDYDYGPHNGPHKWKEMYPAARGCYQSPINIRTDITEILRITEPLIWRHYDDLPVMITIENTGHTVELRAKFECDLPTLSGADLLENYSFVSLRFRWSALDEEGSEHSINNRKYPVELQATHISKDSAQMQPSYAGDLGVLILGYFFTITKFDNPYLDPIVLNLHSIREPMKKIEIPPFPLSWLCYPFKSGFYSYGGSLTEPPCSEGVTWFIHPEPMAISERQLCEFRNLLSKDGCTKIMRNSRPVQNLNSRIVCYNRFSPFVRNYESTTQIGGSAHGSNTNIHNASCDNFSSQTQICPNQVYGVSSQMSQTSYNA